MDLAPLCRRISLPEEAIGPVLRRSETPVSEDILRALTVPDTAPDAYQACKALCNNRYLWTSCPSCSAPR